MAISPPDIRSQSFSRRMRGVDADEVRAYLSVLSETVEDLQRELHYRDTRIADLESRLVHYERIEEALQEALRTARESQSSTLAVATQQADHIRAEAHLQARALVQDAESDRNRLRQETQAIAARRKEISARLRAFLMSELEMLAHFEGEDPIGFIQLRREGEDALAGGTTPVLPATRRRSDVRSADPAPAISEEAPFDADAAANTLSAASDTPPSDAPGPADAGSAALDSLIVDSQGSDARGIDPVAPIGDGFGGDAGDVSGLTDSPVETGPVETGPVETGPVETGPVETQPVDAALAAPDAPMWVDAPPSPAAPGEPWAPAGTWPPLPAQEGPSGAAPSPVSPPPAFAPEPTEAPVPPIPGAPPVRSETAPAGAAPAPPARPRYVVTSLLGEASHGAPHETPEAADAGPAAPPFVPAAAYADGSAATLPPDEAEELARVRRLLDGLGQ